MRPCKTEGINLRRETVYIPKTVKIGAYSIEVQRFNRGRGESSDEWGRTNLFDMRIGIRDDLPEPLEAQVFLHEIVEIALKRLDINDLPHHTLSLIAEELFAIIRNNELDFTGGKP
jgi:hypothetical protein